MQPSRQRDPRPARTGGRARCRHPRGTGSGHQGRRLGQRRLGRTLGRRPGGHLAAGVPLVRRRGSVRTARARPVAVPRAHHRDVRAPARRGPHGRHGPHAGDPGNTDRRLTGRPALLTGAAAVSDPALGSGHGRRGGAAGVLRCRPDPAPREGAPQPRRLRPDAGRGTLRRRRPDDRAGDRAQPDRRARRAGPEERRGARGDRQPGVPDRARPVQRRDQRLAAQAA